MMETYDYDHQYILTLYHYIIPLYAPCPYSDFRWGGALKMQDSYSA